jgi:hypothetical protein
MTQPAAAFDSFASGPYRIPACVPPTVVPSQYVSLLEEKPNDPNVACRFVGFPEIIDKPTLSLDLKTFIKMDQRERWREWTLAADDALRNQAFCTPRNPNINCAWYSS